MFIEPALVIWIEATKVLFGEDFPYADMQEISVHTEYPLDEASYPGIWVQFLPQGDVRNVGIGHMEYVEGEGGNPSPVFRWKFSGLVEITAAGMSSLERARMIDWLAKGIAFSGDDEVESPTSPFRRYVETNDLVGLNVMWEAFTVTGFAETPGTPWGTDDVIYEATVTLSMEGEVFYRPSTMELVPLSMLEIQPTLDEGNHVHGGSSPTDGWM